MYKELNVINDAFLTVADTISYYELSLRPPPPPDYFERNTKTTKFPLYHHFIITVPDTLYPLSDWGRSLKLFCKGISNKDSFSLLELKNSICKEIEEDNEKQSFNINKIKNVGKYILVKENTQYNSKFPQVGKIQFSQVAFSKNGTIAAFMAFISDGEKSGIEKLFILSKEDKQWKVIKIETFAIH